MKVKTTRSHKEVETQKEGKQSRDREEKHDGHEREQNVERDLVRRLLALGAFDQSDHSIEEGFARVRGDSYHQPVRENLGTSRYGGAVAA